MLGLLSLALLLGARAAQGDASSHLRGVDPKGEPIRYEQQAARSNSDTDSLSFLSLQPTTSIDLQPTTPGHVSTDPLQSPSRQSMTTIAIVSMDQTSLEHRPVGMRRSIVRTKVISRVSF